ncbi:hypothetical protein DL98DRAFT_598913 [Cadophora sp. DSE1049]|nr:hypothetical protein DL98DRAFT_598913 [Cadophora sp. DSE1049]
MTSQKNANVAIGFHYLLEMENGDIKTSLTTGALEYQPDVEIIVTHDGSEWLNGWRRQISPHVCRMVKDLEQIGDYLFEDIKTHGRLWVRMFAIRDDCLTTDDKIKRTLSHVKKKEKNPKNSRNAILDSLRWWMTDKSLVQHWECRQQQA